MAGLSVSCGSFEGGDESASALDVVLKGAPARVMEAIRPIFEGCSVSLPVEIAAPLLDQVSDNRKAPTTRLGHGDVERADRDAREAGETRLRRSPVWELYRANDVICACKAAAVERGPVVSIHC